MAWLCEKIPYCSNSPFFVKQSLIFGYTLLFPYIIGYQSYRLRRAMEHRVNVYMYVECNATHTNIR